jgi:hypothetical protein
MLKPNNYDNSSTCLRSVPYEFADEDGGRMAGGVLGKGRVIWTSVSKVERNPVRAYIDGIGLVFVDGRFIAPLPQGLSSRDSAQVRRSR